MAHVFQTKRRDGTPHPRWRFEFRDCEGRKRKGTGYKSKAETQKLADRLQAEQDDIRKGYRPPPKPSDQPRAFEDVRDEYLAWGNDQGGRGGRPWSERHARMKATHLAWWKEQLNLRMLSDLVGALGRVEKALRRLRDKGRAGKTLANYAESLASFCDWAVAREYLAEDPLRRLGAFDTTPGSIRRAITGEELKRLLAVVPPDRRLLYEVATCTGLRANELRSLTVDDLDVDNGGLRLDAAWTKNRKPGFQPLPTALVERLRERTQDASSDSALLDVPAHTARTLNRDLKKAGIPKTIPGEGKLDFHAFRVAYTTLVIEAGATVKEAQSLARHAGPQLTMQVYARTRADRLAAVAQRVGDAVLGPTAAPKRPQSPPEGSSGNGVNGEGKAAYVSPEGQVSSGWHPAHTCATEPTASHASILRSPAWLAASARAISQDGATRQRGPNGAGAPPDTMVSSSLPKTSEAPATRGLRGFCFPGEADGTRTRNHRIDSPISGPPTRRRHRICLAFG